jgi:hypothetical protein
MPFTEPYKPQDQIEQVRKVGRLAQIILDMRLEYERRPRPDLLGQIMTRIAEMEALRAEMASNLAASPSTEPAGHNHSPQAGPNGAPVAEES